MVQDYGEKKALAWIATLTAKNKYRPDPVTGDDGDTSHPPHLTHNWVLSEFWKVVVNTEWPGDIRQVRLTPGDG